ncbi:PRC and DUF2382 domain-containing protein [Actinophytocola sediminis]
MIGQNMVSRLYDCEVIDTKGEKIGSVKRVWVDDQTGAPVWASVHTGLFGMRESFVPLQSAELREDEVRVPIEKDRVKDSPKIDAANDRITEDEQAELMRYYGFGPQRTSPEGSGKRQSGQQTGQQQAGMAGMTGQRSGQQATQRSSQQTTTRGSTKGSGQQSGQLPDGEAMTRSEEHLRIATERVETGKVRLVKHVVTEEQQVNVPVSHEEVRVVREPITDQNRDSAMVGEISEAQQEIILHADKPVVTKETVAVERVRLVKEEVTDTETVSGQIRKEEIDVQDDRKGRRAR